jgi:NAD(P)H-dependent flavin oxidoreductase YrpB (nitropropane dioxygenase family)
MSKFNLSTLRLPIIQAPMAGGPNTPELAAAVGAAGGLGSFGFAYSRANAIKSSIEMTRKLNPSVPVNANFFVFSSVDPPNEESARLTYFWVPVNTPLALAGSEHASTPTDVSCVSDMLSAVTSCCGQRDH